MGKPNYVVKLFRGEISLPVTYWVFYVLVGSALFSTAFALVEVNYLKLVITWGNWATWAVTGLYWLSIGYGVFITIALVRSATKYRGARLWANLAILIAGLNLLMLGFSVVEQINNPDSEQDQLNYLNAGLPMM